MKKNIIILLLICLFVFSIFYKKGSQEKTPSQYIYVHDTIEKEINIVRTILKKDTIKQKEIKYMTLTVSKVDTQIVLVTMNDTCKSYDDNYIDVTICNNNLSLKMTDTIACLITRKRKIPLIGKVKYYLNYDNTSPYIKTNVNATINERNNRRLRKPIDQRK